MIDFAVCSLQLIVWLRSATLGGCLAWVSGSIEWTLVRFQRFASHMCFLKGTEFEGTKFKGTEVSSQSVCKVTLLKSLWVWADRCHSLNHTGQSTLQDACSISELSTGNFNQFEREIPIWMAQYGSNESDTLLTHCSHHFPTGPYRVLFIQLQFSVNLPDAILQLSLCWGLTENWRFLWALLWSWEPQHVAESTMVHIGGSWMSCSQLESCTE